MHYVTGPCYSQLGEVSFGAAPNGLQVYNGLGNHCFRLLAKWNKPFGSLPKSCRFEAPESRCWSVCGGAVRLVRTPCLLRPRSRVESRGPGHSFQGFNSPSNAQLFAHNGEQPWIAVQRQHQKETSLVAGPLLLIIVCYRLRKSSHLQYGQPFWRNRT